MNEHDCILVVDDRESMRQIIADILYLSGYEVLEAKDEEEALTIANTKQVDAIIADINVEGTGGISFISKLRSIPNYQSIPILIQTTDNKFECVEDRKQADGTDWMVKPFDTDGLIDTINSFLD